LLKAKVPSPKVKGTFWKISQKVPHFEKESYGTAKIFGGIGQISFS
jgi:hypothetical protein